MFRHQDAPAQVVRYARAQGVGCGQVTMHYKNLVRALGAAAQPVQQLPRVGVGGCRLQLHHFCVDSHVVAVDTPKPASAATQ